MPSASVSECDVQSPGRGLPSGARLAVYCMSERAEGSRLALQPWTPAAGLPKIPGSPS